jgi:hypothetical protein
MNCFSLRVIASIALCSLCIVSCGRFSNKLDYTFVVAGDDRLAAEDTVGNPSTTNIYHIKRTFEEIAQFNPLPKYLFFNGDLVMGYTDNDTVRLAHELKEWIKLYKASGLESKGVMLVAITGNHEVVEKLGSGKIAFASDERTFVREMKEYIRGNNGPHATGFIPGTDSLMSDQSRLSYSFDYGGDHFVILNTDAVARESRVAWHWLKKDLEDAREHGARHIFLFSHKPPFKSHYEGEAGLEENKSNRDSLWAVVEKYNCDVYFASHFHLWDTVQPHKGKTIQVICGNAGAPMTKDWLPYYYGFTVVNVSSKVGITSMGHDVDREHYMAPVPDNKTIIRCSFSIQQP